jgi:threonyl-tRNA synthetase
MKELHLSWSELKSLPRNELEGLLYGLSQYTRMHQFDGYNEEEIGEMAKDRPQVRSDYYQYRELKDKYDARLGVKKQTKSVDELRGELKL